VSNLGTIADTFKAELLFNFVSRQVGLLLNQEDRQVFLVILVVYFVEYKNTVPDEALFDDGSEVSIVGWRCRKRGKPLGTSNFNGVIPTLFGMDYIVVRNERTIADDYKVYALSNEHSSNITNNCKTLVGDLKLMEECVESLTKLVELEIFSRIQ
jgi:hypothetical protein